MNDLVPGYEDAPAWFGLFTTGGTPKNIVNDLSKKIDAILKEPAVVTTMNNQAVIIVGGSIALKHLHNRHKAKKGDAPGAGKAPKQK